MDTGATRLYADRLSLTVTWSSSCDFRELCTFDFDGCRWEAGSISISLFQNACPSMASALALSRDVPLMLPSDQGIGRSASSCGL